MEISFFHLNIESGRFLDEIIAYVKEHNFDLLHFQELSAGSWNRYNHIDIFSEITKRLGYHGELAKTVGVKNDSTSYFANATFFKPDFAVLKKKIIWLHPYQELSEPSQGPRIDAPRNLLHLTLQKGDSIFQSLNTHLTWGPTPDDEPYKVEQGKILYEYLQKVDSPFVLSGDFNVTNNSQIVQWLQTIGRDLATEQKLTNTLNAKTHRVKKIFPPGLAVDYIFVDKQATIQDFQLVDHPDLSDHLGLHCKLIF